MWCCVVLNICGAVLSWTYVVLCCPERMWCCVVLNVCGAALSWTYVVLRCHRQFCRLFLLLLRWAKQSYLLGSVHLSGHPVTTAVLRTALADSLRMTLAVCFCCAQIKWTEYEQETLKYVVAYQKHLAKLQVFVSWFCNRIRNVVCSNFGIWLKATSVIAASASTDSETKNITDFISPWTYGFAFLQSS